MNCDSGTCTSFVLRRLYMYMFCLLTQTVCNAKSANYSDPMTRRQIAKERNFLTIPPGKPSVVCDKHIAIVSSRKFRRASLNEGGWGGTF